MAVFCQVIEGLVEEEALGSYVLVEKEDVLDAVSTFIAAYLATIPEAQHMKPTDLQQALTSTFQVPFLQCHNWMLCEACMLALPSIECLA